MKSMKSITVKHRHGAISGWRWLPILAAAVIFTDAAYSADPYLRVGLFVIDTRSEQNNSVPEVITFAPSIAPAEGKVLRLYADSNTPAAFLVVAVDGKTKDVSKTWLPRIWIQTKEFSEIRFPAKDEDEIPYAKGIALDLLVVRIPLTYDRLPDLRALVQRMSEYERKKNDPGLIASAGRIREEVEGWFQRQNKVSCIPQYRPPAKAATQRAGSPELVWREEQLVHKFVLTDTSTPFVVRFPISPALSRSASVDNGGR